MYGIFTYIYHKNQPNVGKYSRPMDPMGLAVFLVTCDYADAPGLGVPKVCLVANNWQSDLWGFGIQKKSQSVSSRKFVETFWWLFGALGEFFFWHIFCHKIKIMEMIESDILPSAMGGVGGKMRGNMGSLQLLKNIQRWAQKPVRSRVLNPDKPSYPFIFGNL